MNPSGVVFGPNASLDVSGSFHVSTADYLRFADGAKFFANPSQGSILSVAPVTAFGFLSETPSPISIQRSDLRVPVGRTLSVIGGDIQFVGERLSCTWSFDCAYWPDQYRKRGLAWRGHTQQLNGGSRSPC